MLIHGGFWKEQYTHDLMQPIAEDLAERVSPHGTLNTSGGLRGRWRLDGHPLRCVERGGTSRDSGIDMHAPWSWASAGGQLALLMGAAERRPGSPLPKPPSQPRGATTPTFQTEGDAARRWISSRQGKRSGVAATQLSTILPDVLLFHGEHDVEVPLEQSETYAQL